MSRKYDNIVDILNETSNSLIETSWNMLDSIQRNWDGTKIRDVTEVDMNDREVVRC